MITKGTIGNHGELHGNRQKVLEEYNCKCAGDNCMCARFFYKIYLHLPGMIIARHKRFFRCILAHIWKSKKCIIFNVDYRLGSKNSKFDMTLIRQSPFEHKS